MGKLRPHQIFNSELVRNIVALYGLQFANYLLPMITIPYLARVLGPTAWGIVAVAQSFGGYIVLLVEYGFNLSATREVARTKDDRVRLAELVGGVMGAKVLLAVASLAGAIAVRRFVPALMGEPKVFWAAVVWAIGQALNMAWYFQGREKMRQMAALDIVAKAASTAGLFFLVRSPVDAWVALLLQAAASLLSTGVAIVMTHQDVPLRLPVWCQVRDALKMGWTMFLFRNSVSLYTTGNALLLGVFASPEMVGYYVGAEKLIKVTVGLIGPMTQALYPRLSYLVRNARDEAAKLARTGGVIICGWGVLSGAALWLLAPWLVRLLLGHRFTEAVPVLRILVFILPCNAVSNTLGIQWMLPHGMDRQFNTVILGAGVLNIIFAALLGPRFGHMGMASAVVLAELWVAVGTFLAVRRSNTGQPWTGSSART